MEHFSRKENTLTFVKRVDALEATGILLLNGPDAFTPNAVLATITFPDRDAAIRGERMIRNHGKPIEINVMNEGHAFYQDGAYLAKSLGHAKADATTIVRELRKLLPAGTWTANVWQNGKLEAEIQ